ncbi:hypothetical protein [Xanthomonas melonis]|uniref:hypothetical protein n=1 Tax=Xanthomonas melonis TaxID=56456 RepID=UPI003EBAB549
MSDDDARRQLQRLAVLARVRDLQTRKASMALQGTLRESRRAHALEHASQQRVHAVADWKQRAANGLLQLDTYQVALQVEAAVHAEHIQASLEADACDARVEIDRAAHRGASAQERAVDERHRRLSEQTLHERERAESDTSAELWLARRACNGH